MFILSKSLRSIFMKKSLIISIWVSLSLVGTFFQAQAIIGEDLWLDIYKSLDQWVRELRQTQYEYELAGQWDGSVYETVNQILARHWLECQIHSSADIERLIGMSWWNTVEAIANYCASWESTLPLSFAENVQNALIDIRRVFMERADQKAEMTYRVARIWLYADGNTENSPFDLIVDLQEIDRIIFWEEIEYNGVTPVNNQSFHNFINNLSPEEIEVAEEDGAQEDDEIDWNGDEIEHEATEEEEETNWEDISIIIPEHGQICLPPNNSGLDDDVVNDLISRIQPWHNNWWEFVPTINRFLYPEWIRDNRWNWWWPFNASWPDGDFSSSKAPWWCSPDDFFCIIIEFESSNYGLIGWETRSIMKVLSTVAEHCEKPANASLTQRKQTTNNFELWSIIRDLPGTLRWLGIEVSSKPIPILQEIEDDEDPTREDIKEEVKNMLRERYKALWLDYDRQNDIDIFERSTIVQKILQTSVWMPITYPEQRMNEFRSYDRAFVRAATKTPADMSHITTQRQLWWFVNHFNELERFTFALTDYIEQFTWVITTLERIPTRSP